jgi:PPP family 3-phenylpropionic acid transporter
VLFGVVIAAFFPFIALFLDDRGLTAGQIGVVIAAMAVARIASSPVWGHLSDASLGRLRAFQLGMLGTALASIWLSSARGFGLIVVAACVFAVFNATTGPNSDTLALMHLGEERMNDYGRIRQYESFGYAVSCILIGLALDLAGVGWTMAVCAGASFAVLAWTVLLEPDRPAHSGHAGRLGTVGAVFRASPRFWGFLVSALLIWAGFNAAWNFIALKIVRAGGTPLLVGIGTALGGFVEVLAVRSASRLGRTLGLRIVYVVGASIYALGFLLWALVSNPTAVSILTVFEGLGFGLLFTTTVVVIGRMLPSSLYSTGQSLVLTAGFGLGPILGAGIGGAVYDRFGAVTLYVGASLLTAAGGAIGWFVLSPAPLSQPEPGTAVAPSRSEAD